MKVAESSWEVRRRKNLKDTVLYFEGHGRRRGWGTLWVFPRDGIGQAGERSGRTWGPFGYFRREDRPRQRDLTSGRGVGPVVGWIGRSSRDLDYQSRDGAGRAWDRTVSRSGAEACESATPSTSCSK